MNPTIALTIRQGAKPVRYIEALSNDRVDVRQVSPPQNISWRQAHLQALELSHTCDGLLLPGGGDPHPALYGQESDGTPPEAINLPLDILELSLVCAFASVRKPILGICRGVQILNVAFGGTLLQDIAGHGQIEGRDGEHDIALSGARPEGALSAMIYDSLATKTLSVNTAHHQALGRTGDGLVPWAAATDGIIEAVGHLSLPVAGVQWHPERHEDTRDAVFGAFVSML